MITRDPFDAYEYTADNEHHFKRYTVNLDCEALAVFGMSRELAADFLIRRLDIDGIIEILAPAVRSASETDDFVLYLQGKDIDLSVDSDKDIKVIEQFIAFYLLEKKIDVPHPELLIAIATLKNRPMRILVQKDPSKPAEIIAKTDLDGTDAIEITLTEDVKLVELTPIADMGSRAYKAFGWTRNDAYNFIVKRMDKVRHFILPAAQEAARDVNFIEYHALKTPRKIKMNANSTESDDNLIRNYLSYDVLNLSKKNAFPHSSVLMAMAHLRGKTVRLWETSGESLEDSVHADGYVPQSDVDEKHGGAVVAIANEDDIGSRSSGELEKSDLLLMNRQGSPKEREQNIYRFFGLTHHEAIEQLNEHISTVIDLLLPGAQALLGASNDFKEYCVRHGLSDPYDREKVCKAYIMYQMQDMSSETGSVDQLIIQAIAKITNRTLRIWEKQSDNDDLVMREYMRVSHQFSSSRAVRDSSGKVQVMPAEELDFYVEDGKVVQKIDIIRNDKYAQFDIKTGVDQENPFSIFHMSKQEAASFLIQHIDHIDCPIDDLKESSSSLARSALLERMNESEFDLENRAKIAYVLYEICHKEGLPDLKIFQALARLTGRSICFWKLSDDGLSYVLHQDNEVNNQVVSPNTINVVVEKRVKVHRRNHKMPSMHDGGFGALGYSLLEAHHVLFNFLVEPSKRADCFELLAHACRTDLAKSDFVDYLRAKAEGSDPIVKALGDALCAKAKIHPDALALFCKNVEILKHYINFELRDKKSHHGWVRKEIYEALAKLTNVKIVFWRQTVEISDRKNKDAAEDPDSTTGMGRVSFHVQRLDTIVPPSFANDTLHLYMVDGCQFELLDPLPRKYQLNPEQLTKERKKKREHIRNSIAAYDYRSVYQHLPDKDFLIIAKQMFELSKERMRGFYMDLALRAVEQSDWRTLRYLIKNSPRRNVMELMVAKVLEHRDEELQELSDKVSYCNEMLAILITFRDEGQSDDKDLHADLAQKLEAGRDRVIVRLMEDYRQKLEKDQDSIDDGLNVIRANSLSKAEMLANYRKKLYEKSSWPFSIEDILQMGVDRVIDDLTEMTSAGNLEAQEEQLRSNYAGYDSISSRREEVLGVDANDRAESDIYSTPVDEFLNKYRDAMQRIIRWDDIVLLKTETCLPDIEQLVQIAQTHGNKLLFIEVVETDIAARSSKRVQLAALQRERNGVWSVRHFDPTAPCGLVFPEKCDDPKCYQPILIDDDTFNNYILRTGHYYEGHALYRRYDSYRELYKLPPGDFLFEFLTLYPPRAPQNIYGVGGNGLLSIAYRSNNHAIFNALLLLELDVVPAKPEDQDALLKYIYDEVQDARLGDWVNRRIALSHELDIHLATNSGELHIDFCKRWLEDENKLFALFRAFIEHQTGSNETSSAYQINRQIGSFEHFNKYAAWTPLGALSNINDKIIFLLGRFRQIIVVDRQFNSLYAELVDNLQGQPVNSDAHRAALRLLQHVAYYRWMALRYASEVRPADALWALEHAKTITQQKQFFHYWRMYILSSPEGFVEDEDELLEEYRMLTTIHERYLTLQNAFTVSKIAGHNEALILDIEKYMRDFKLHTSRFVGYQRVATELLKVAKAYREDTHSTGKPDRRDLDEKRQKMLELMNAYDQWRRGREEHHEEDHYDKDNIKPVFGTLFVDGKDRLIEAATRRAEEEKAARQRAEEEIAALRARIAALEQGVVRETNPLGDGVDFEVRKIAGDGNCLYAAIADQLEVMGDARGYTAGGLRGLAVAKMREAHARYAAHVAEDMDGYLERQAQEGTWGGELEIEALGEALQVKVHVYDAKRKHVIVYGAAEAESGIYLRYNGENHYDSMRRVAPAAPAMTWQYRGMGASSGGQAGPGQVGNRL